MIYDVSNKLEEFLQRVEAGEIPEEAIKDTLESLEGELEDNLDQIACSIKNYRAEAEAIDAEIFKLEVRASGKRKKAEDRLKFLSDFLHNINRSGFETSRNKVKFRKLPLSVQMSGEFEEWAKANRKDFLIIKEPVVTISKTAVREALEAGENLQGVELIGGEKLQIK